MAMPPMARRKMRKPSASRTALPRSSLKIDRRVCTMPPSAHEAQRLDLVPRDLDPAVRRGAAKDGRSEVDVVPLHGRAIEEDRRRRVPKVCGGEIRRKRADNGLTGEDETRQAQEANAPLHRILLESHDFSLALPG